MGRVILVMLIIAAAPAAAGDRQPFENTVRSADHGLRTAIREARLQSPTFRALIERLERSDVIVYIARQYDMPGMLDGQLHFITTAGGRRYLRIRVAARLSAARLAAILAHELRHAVEIADASDVVDAATLAAAYDRITTWRTVRGGGTIAFETRAAVDTAARVWGELSSSGADD